jgi:outer membrane receptor protein involved in Fe transport
MSTTIISAQKATISISGIIKDKTFTETLPYVNVVLKKQLDSSFIAGTITDDNGQFTISDITSDKYILEVTYVGYKKYSSEIFVGNNSKFINLGIIVLEENVEQINEVIITAKKNSLAETMDKKIFSIKDNVSQNGGSVLQTMANLPGITTQEGQVQLRGNSKVIVLINGKQSAITGFGNQNGLDNIPASAVERIEVINNPSSKYDANGNAGIINIILKKEDQSGFNGKVGITTGLGALWVREENLAGIRPQYTATPKINPSLSLNYRKEKVNFFIQADNLYTETLNKNEFVTRRYSNGDVINQQLKRNRNTNFFTSRLGLDWFINDKNTLTVSGFYSQETIKDFGDQPFFNAKNGNNLRLWQFLEDEVLTAAMASVVFEHQFNDPGHELKINFNYTFDREDEKYFFTNTQPSFTTNESFFLIADQKVADFSLDYVKPNKYGVFEAGFKFRHRTIPTDMQFNPSANNSVLDTGADGKATYNETIPAVYGNFIYETEKLEVEVGVRVEYVDLFYEVDPNHNTYKSNGYNYFQPFPNVRLAYNLKNGSKISAFFNRRVDRPDEVDIRIFPKYDDAEIIKVGNPELQPQFTNRFEIGYKKSWNSGDFYSAIYHNSSDGTITRIATSLNNSNLIYNISQNGGKSYNSGLEFVINQKISENTNMNLNMNGYYNQIDAFTVVNKYPVTNVFTADKQNTYAGNIKLNTNFKLPKNIEAQISAVYLSSDIIPQGKIDARFSLDAGIKKSIQKGKGELFLNATDLFNTLVIAKQVTGTNFSYTSKDYYETQVIRFGYSYKF